MAYSDLLSELLGIDKLRVIRTEIDSAEQITLFVESVEEVAVCPECKQLSLQIHVSLQIHGLCDRQLIHDLSYGERRCYLSYQAQRFRCSFCDKTFTEGIFWKRTGVSYTLRYEKHVYQRAHKEPVNQIAQDEGLSEETVQAIFEHWAHLPWPAVPGKKRLRHEDTRKSK